MRNGNKNNGYIAVDEEESSYPTYEEWKRSTNKSTS